MNKRKAMIGWVVYSIGKRVAKRTIKAKAKSAIPSGSTSRSRRIPGAAAVAAVGAVLGGLVFWRRRRSPGDELTES